MSDWFEDPMEWDEPELMRDLDGVLVPADDPLPPGVYCTTYLTESCDWDRDEDGPSWSPAHLVTTTLSIRQTVQRYFPTPRPVRRVAVRKGCRIAVARRRRTATRGSPSRKQEDGPCHRRERP